LGRIFLLKTDNISLKYFFEQKYECKTSKMLGFPSEYDFEIKHIKGKENKVEDALSRKLNAIFSNNIQYDLKQKIVTTTKKDEEYKKIREKCQNNQLTNRRNKV
jgi:NADH pyrophosphatase NudC (nudix superfamily)